jgi:hypothetical protein
MILAVPMNFGSCRLAGLNIWLSWFPLKKKATVEAGKEGEESGKKSEGIEMQESSKNYVYINIDTMTSIMDF